MVEVSGGWVVVVGWLSLIRYDIWGPKSMKNRNSFCPNVMWVRNGSSM